MAIVTRKRVKYALAGLGVVYAVLFVAYLVLAAVEWTKPQGPSELEAHPERQDEILAMRRASEFQGRLDLSDEQTEQVAQLFFDRSGAGRPGDGGEEGGFGGMRGMRDEIQKILTPEQIAKAEEMRGRPDAGRPRGGRGGMMSDERVNALKQQMTPEQQERFDKKVARWRERRQQRGGGGFGRRGPR